MPLLLATLALAADHVDTLGAATYDESMNDACWWNVITATTDGEITGLQAYARENDSTASPRLTFAVWDRIGSGAWSETASLGAITLTNGSAAWISSNAGSVPVVAGRTYAVGSCTSNEIIGYYAASSTAIDPVWGTFDGYTVSYRTEPPATTIETDIVIHMRVSFGADDDDGDGYDVFDDCDDTDASVNPGETETWYNGVDNACDGGSDYDQDGDGFESDAYGGEDCDDTDEYVNPDRSSDEWYDGVDTDCAGNSDYDRDEDGHDSDQYGGGDCDDDNPRRHPDAAESWYDGVDGDCSGGSDYDQDGDGHEAQSAGGDDCDDTDPRVATDCSGSDNGGGDTDENDGNGGGKKDSTEESGCCSGGSALLLTGLVLGVSRKRRGAPKGSSG